MLSQVKLLSNIELHQKESCRCIKKIKQEFHLPKQLAKPFAAKLSHVPPVALSKSPLPKDGPRTLATKIDFHMEIWLVCIHAAISCELWMIQFQWARRRASGMGHKRRAPPAELGRRQSASSISAMNEFTLHLVNGLNQQSCFEWHSPAIICPLAPSNRINGLRSPLCLWYEIIVYAIQPLLVYLQHSGLH